MCKLHLTDLGLAGKGPHYKATQKRTILQPFKFQHLKKIHMLIGMHVNNGLFMSCKFCLFVCFEDALDV